MKGSQENFEILKNEDYSNKEKNHFTNNITLNNRKRKKDNVSSSKDEKCTKDTNMLKRNPIDLMARFEKFSDVWNDCPDIKRTHIFINHELLEENTNVKNNSNMVPINTNKKVTCSLPDTTNKDSYLKVNSYPIVKNIDKFGQSHYGFKKSATEISDLKRKKAVDEQRQLQFDKKKIIKQALSAEGGKTNKKIVFNDDNDTELKESPQYISHSETNNRLKLFEDDSEVNSDLKLNNQFEGREGRKLLELQSKYAYDSRFTLDNRFNESDSEASDNEGSDENHKTEKEKQLAILGSIVNREIKPLSQIKKKTKLSDLKWMVRFDPTREDHSKYLLQPKEPKVEKDIVDSNKNKSKEKRKPKKEVCNENNKSEIKPKVTNEKFYAVKEDLKEVLNTEKKTDFSLLKLFGSKETAEPNDETEEPQSLKKPKYNTTKNPFKYDSSDSEKEETVEPKNIEVSSSKSAAHLWRTTFFFTENDSRLNEAWEFLKSPADQEGENEFAEKRKLLKAFIKSKFKKVYRKNSTFKKKLGGRMKRVSNDKSIKH